MAQNISRLELEICGYAEIEKQKDEAFAEA